MNDDLQGWLDALANTNPGDPLPPAPPINPEQQLKREWGEEYGALVADHLRDTLAGRTDAGRRERMAELHTILRDAGDDTAPGASSGPQSSG